MAISKFFTANVWDIFGLDWKCKVNCRKKLNDENYGQRTCSAKMGGNSLAK